MGFFAGTLDILSAIIFLASGHAVAVFRHIAKAALGNSALEGGLPVIILGAIFHYMIAYCFSTGYFLVYPHIPFLKKLNIISGLLYGIYIWAFMNYLVLPLTFDPPNHATFQNSWKSIVILMLAIGMPVSWITRKYYSGRATTDLVHGAADIDSNDFPRKT